MNERVNLALMTYNDGYLNGEGGGGGSIYWINSTIHLLSHHLTSLTPNLTYFPHRKDTFSEGHGQLNVFPNTSSTGEIYTEPMSD